MAMQKGKASLEELEAWAWKQGSVGNPGLGKNSYLGECVSFIQCYLYFVFGIEYASRGHAVSYTPPSSHFKSIPVTSKLQPGDIIRYGSNYGWGYGHIGLIDDDGEYLDQNGVKARAIGERGKPFVDIRAVFRPTKKFLVKSPKPAPKKPSGRIKKSGQATVIVGKLNVRTDASTKAKVAATYKKNESFNYDSYIDKNGYRWLSYVSYSGARRYVAQRTSDKKTNFVKGGV